MQIFDSKAVRNGELMGKHDIEFISFLSKLFAVLLEATKEMNSWLEKRLWSEKQQLVKLRSTSFSFTPEDWQLRKIFLNYRLRTAYCSFQNEMEWKEMQRNEMEICSLQNENL